MKLLSKLGACWQSPPPPPVSGFEQENATASLNPRPKRRRPTAGSSEHWQPALTVISEDSCMAAYGGDERKTKLLEKERRTKAIRVRVKPSNCDDSSWKVQAQIAIPAFSAAPFMF